MVIIMMVLYGFSQSEAVMLVGIYMRGEEIRDKNSEFEILWTKKIDDLSTENVHAVLLPHLDWQLLWVSDLDTSTFQKIFK